MPSPSPSLPVSASPGLPPDPAITLLNQKNLATALGVPAAYVSAMVFSGFPMPGGRATINEALEWRRANPKFNASSARKKVTA